jgi:hypothetical protein
VDAPAGTLVFVPDVSTRRSAVAVEADTTALVVGGPADRPLPVSPFEFYFVAEAPYLAGDYAHAIQIASEGLADWPDHPVIHYQLACYHALAGNRDDAFDHLERARQQPTLASKNGRGRTTTSTPFATMLASEEPLASVMGNLLRQQPRASGRSASFSLTEPSSPRAPSQTVVRWLVASSAA